MNKFEIFILSILSKKEWTRIITEFETDKELDCVENGKWSLDYKLILIFKFQGIVT